MQYYYMNNHTGALLTKKEALKIWCEEYDGDDPTNDVPFSEVFSRTDIEIKMKYYNVELTPLCSGELKQFLHDAGITFETSGAGDLVHFEISASEKQAVMINSFLDTLYL